MSDPEPQTKDVLRSAVGQTCQRLQSQYFSAPGSRSHASARATLAELRRNATLDVDNNPLGLSKALFAMDGAFAERLGGTKDELTPSERAAFVALTLFAIHMQSATEPVFKQGISFASACGQLHAKSASGSIKPRIDAMLLASSEKARLVHIRSIVMLLRDRQIGFDYGLLARDLRALSNPRLRAGVQLRWGRDFANSFFKSAESEAK